MADQIDCANIIRVERDEDVAVWVARIGPKGAFPCGIGPTPELAVKRLMLKCEAQGWPWDSDWRDTQ